LEFDLIKKLSKQHFELKGLSKEDIIKKIKDDKKLATKIIKMNPLVEVVLKQ
jgi:hypothetical protein